MFLFTNQKNEIINGSLYDFVRRYSKRLNISAPKIYAVNKAEPVAFSFRSFKSAIFLSIGLFDILDRKETEAVVLHELAHIKQKSSIIKFSNQILNVFSPLSIVARFNHDSSYEEEAADKFVVKVQKTAGHISSAKMKLRDFDRHYSNYSNHSK
jgi:Zn-dependent protease with chaperone function